MLTQASPLATVTPSLARAQLLVPMRVPGEAVLDPARWVDEDRCPSGFEELLPHFQRLIQPEDAVGRGPRWRRHRLEPTVAQALSAGVTVDTLGGRPLLAPTLTGADLTVTPTGDALLALHLAYPAGAPLDRICDSFSALRRATEARLDHDPLWRVSVAGAGAGSALDGAFHCVENGARDVLSLRALATALVGLPRDDGVARGGFAYGHASVTLDAQPPPEVLEDALYRLSRGVPTPFERPQAGALGVRVLSPRGNRRVAVARESVASLSWPAGGVSLEDEQRWAIERFHGIYRLLHLHVHSERLAIAGFSDRAARLAGALDPDALLAQQGAVSGLLVEITAYTLTLTGEECGGNGDHVAFFAALRQAHLIAAQRDELRAEIDELRALLRAVENARDQLAAEAERQASQDERDFQRRISLLAFFITPLAVVTGVLGVNVDVGEGQPMLFPLDAALWVLAGAYGLSALMLGRSTRRR